MLVCLQRRKFTFPVEEKHRLSLRKPELQARQNISWILYSPILAGTRQDLYGYRNTHIGGNGWKIMVGRWFFYVHKGYLFWRQCLSNIIYTNSLVFFKGCEGSKIFHKPGDTFPTGKGVKQVDSVSPKVFTDSLDGIFRKRACKNAGLHIRRKYSDISGSQTT